MLKVDKLNVFYGDVQVLWDVTFDVKKNEILAVLGPNAAGKTTLLKTISGLLRPKSGLIYFNEKRIDNLSSSQIVESGIIQIPEGRLLFSYMSVIENLEIGAHAQRARGKMKENIDKVYQLFPRLKERARQKAYTLSGGEQQMLAVARGLMASPELLILDEPSLGLAPKMVFQLFQIITRLNEEGITILLVEQNVFESLKIAHRGYVMENGSIVMEGKSDELKDNDHVKRAYLGM